MVSLSVGKKTYIVYIIFISLLCLGIIVVSFLQVGNNVNVGVVISDLTLNNSTFSCGLSYLDNAKPIRIDFSGSGKTDSVYCTWSTGNIALRILLSLFTMIYSLAMIKFVAISKKRGAILITMVLYIVLFIAYFYSMILDAASIDSSRKVCAAIQWNLPPGVSANCNYSQYIGLASFDFFFVGFFVLIGTAVTFRFMRGKSDNATPVMIKATDEKGAAPIIQEESN